MKGSTISRYWILKHKEETVGLTEPERNYMSALGKMMYKNIRRELSGRNNK